VKALAHILDYAIIVNQTVLLLLFKPVRKQNLLMRVNIKISGGAAKRRVTTI
jgi:hypothetical protein